MKTTLFFLYLCTAIVVCEAAPKVASRQAAATIEPKHLVGNWYRGDGTGFNVTITFNKDLTYSAVWTGCLGTYGTAQGTWQLAKRTVKFTPTEEKDMMRKHLRQLDVESTADGILLVPPDVRKQFKQYGSESRFWCYKSVKPE